MGNLFCNNGEFVVAENIDKLIKKNKEIRIGLFDRTNDRYYFAKAIDIAYKISSRTLSPNKNNTPNYYNHEKVECWFKLKFIEKINLNLFLEFFKIIPTEDNTFYSIPYSPTDKSDKRITIKNSNILHLSDIHLGADFGFPKVTEPNNKELLEIIKNYFEFKYEKEIGLIVITGDLISRATSHLLFDTCMHFLHQLCELFGLNKEEIVIVPGNHDIPIENHNFFTYSHESAYKAFLEKFYCSDKEIYGIEKYMTKDGLKIDILRINSSRLRSEHDMNFGYVGWVDYKRLIEKEIDFSDESIKIAVLHHHLVSVPHEESLDNDYKYGSISVAIDSGRIIEGLLKYDFNLVLHGHQHIPGCNKIHRGIKNDLSLNLDKGLCLVGAGSAGSAGAKNDRLSDHLRDNSFSIIELSNSCFNIHSLQYNPAKEPETFFKSTINY